MTMNVKFGFQVFFNQNGGHLGFFKVYVFVCNMKKYYQLSWQGLLLYLNSLKTTSQQTLLISTKFLLTDQEKWRPFWIFSQNHVEMMCDVKNNTRNGFLIPKNLLSHVLHDHISSFVIFKFSVDQNGGHFGFLAPKSYAHPGF